MDVDRVEALVKLLHGAHARELVVEADGWKVSVTKGGSSPRPAPALRRGPAEPAPVEAPTDRVWITASLVGIFRAGSAEIAVGDYVEPGQSLGGIEAMKILNPLTSEVGGEITALAVEDGQPVEYGQRLMQMRCEDER